MPKKDDEKQRSLGKQHDEAPPEHGLNVVAVAFVGQDALLGRKDMGETHARTCGTAISCPFGDAARWGSRLEGFAAAWLVGNEAQALIDCGITDGTELSVVRDPRRQNELRRQVGLIAALLEEHADLLQTGANLKTVFFLRADEPKKLPVPPFWLVYALRRFGWPGQVFLRQATDPMAALKLFDFQPTGPRVLTRPVLGMVAGAFDPETQIHLGPLNPDGDILPETATPLQVQTSLAGDRPEMFAPVLSMLPVERQKLFFDSLGGPLGRLTIWGGTSTPHSRNYRVHIGRDDPGGDMVAFGWVSEDDAPVAEGTSYRVSVEIDIWGRLFVSLSDRQGHPIPIRPKDDRQGRTTQRLPLRSLLFPRSEDEHELLRPSFEHHAQTGLPIEEADSVTLLDNTSFNGRPVTGSALENREEDVRKPFQTAMFWTHRLKEYGSDKNRLDREGIMWMEVARKALAARIDLEDDVSAPFDSLLDRREPDWKHILQQVADGDAVLFGPDLDRFDRIGIQKFELEMRPQERRVFFELMHFTPKTHSRLREEFKRYADAKRGAN